MRLSIISGQSGSGKSVALATLEDEGFYCIDNLPSVLLPDLIEKVIEAPETRTDRIAIGIDARSDGASFAVFPSLIADLRKRSTLTVEVVFLETNRGTLIKRFSETRRRHPLTAASTPLDIAIEHETEVLTPIRSEADLIIDTSALNLHQLRETIRDQVVREDNDGPALLFQSFGFKHGAPENTDFVFDVRCLPNPHWEPTLRDHTGREQPVIEFLQQHPSVEKMYTDITRFLTEWLPLFRQENRAYLTISIGCTGGRHRSVYLSEKLGAHFATLTGNVSIKHRELG